MEWKDVKKGVLVKSRKYPDYGIGQVIEIVVNNNPILIIEYSDMKHKSDVFNNVTGQIEDSWTDYKNCDVYIPEVKTELKDFIEEILS